MRASKAPAAKSRAQKGRGEAEQVTQQPSVHEQYYEAGRRHERLAEQREEQRVAFPSPH